MCGAARVISDHGNAPPIGRGRTGSATPRGARPARAGDAGHRTTDAGSGYSLIAQSRAAGYIVLSVSGLALQPTKNATSLGSR